MVDDQGLLGVLLYMLSSTGVHINRCKIRSYQQETQVCIE